MVGTGRHQVAKENCVRPEQRGRSRPQLNLMPGLRSPVTSSASRETEAQKEGTSLLKMKAGLGVGGVQGKQWKACSYSLRTSKWSYQCCWVWGQPCSVVSWQAGLHPEKEGMGPREPLSVWAVNNRGLISAPEPRGRSFQHRD